MNKLVSRNPIQRFKQGRKIVKAQWGLRTRDDGVIVNSAGIPVGKFIKGNSYDYEKDYPEDKLILPGLYQDNYNGNIYSPDINGNGDYVKVLNGPSPIQNGTYYETKDSSGKVIEKGRYFGGKKHPLPLGNDSNVKTINNPQDLYQEKLNQGIQIFGKKKNNKTKKTNIIDIMPFEAPLVEKSTINVSQPIETSSLETNIHPEGEMPVKQTENSPSSRKFYNKAEVRDYIRRHGNGKGAYSFTADYRKALRKVLNGQGSQDDYNMVKAMGLDTFKVGGILPSRNIVERFKNRINKN